MQSGKTMGGNRTRGFTASDLNFKHQGMSHIWGHLLSLLDTDSISAAGQIFDTEKVAAFTMDFFNKIPRDRYTFFIEKEEQLKTIRRNPLEGSYPYGRTGKSVRDPLQAIFHFKYSKRGEPSVRCVTPGRLSPVTPPGGSPPCEGERKLKRGPSGKYRHIASYSLEELIDLGWDGAMYTSTRARHAASGLYCPFIAGYDSDSEEEYEPIDVQRGKREGTIGLSASQVGLYMTIPNPNDLHGRQRLVQIKNGR